jgi:MFS family permease
MMEGPYKLGQRWSALGLLTLCYTLSFIDRQALTLLVEPVQQSLQISDSQFALLHGAPFALFYAIFGILIGRAADRTDRRAIIASSVLFWSIATVSSGLARSFWQLLVARVGVALGEGALPPAAYSLISDTFAPNYWGRAMSVFASGIYFGAASALLLGGYLMSTLPAELELAYPPVKLAQWQLVLIVLGCLGLPLALAAALMKEPLRRTPTKTAASTAELIQLYRRNWPLYASHHFGFGLFTFIGYAVNVWVPTFFMRSFDWTAAQIGMRYGLVMLICSPIGLLIGGAACDWLRTKGYLDAHVRGSLFSTALLPVPIATLTLSGDPEIAFASLIAFNLAFSFHTGVGVAALHDFTPHHFHGTATAIFMLCSNIIGLGGGPLAVALLTDFVFQDRYAVGQSLLVAGLGAMVIVALLLRKTMRLLGANGAPALRGDAASTLPAQP